ncbi:MAG: ABC transporter permease [Ignavibacteriaceae bacterium]
MNKTVLRLLLRRLFSSIVILFLLLSFVFILLRLAPGDISQKFISPQLSPELREKVIKSFNLDASLPEQYGSFISNLLKGDFGISYNYKTPVIEVIQDHVPFTLMFTLSGFIVQASIGILLALIAIRRINSRTDKIISQLSLFMYSVPTFVVGVFLIYIFSVILNIFPSSGLMSYDHYSFSFAGKAADYIKHLTLPVLTLAFGGIAVYYKYLRDNIEEVYNKTFVMNLRANGFSENEIMLKHIIPNALNPLITIAGIELGILFNGALITEVIFGLPGMGRLIINSILSRDYPMVTGCTFIAGGFVILSNFLADLLKAKLDKRLLKGIIN